MARIASIPDFLAKCQEVFPEKTELTSREIKSYCYTEYRWSTSKSWF